MAVYLSADRKISLLPLTKLNKEWKVNIDDQTLLFYP